MIQYFLNLTLSIIYLDKNVICYFIYLHMSLKKRRLFLQNNDRGIFVKTLSKIEEGLDFEILVFKVSFNQISLKTK